MDPDLQQRLLALAARQQNNVSREQLLDLGFGREAIKYRVRTHSLHRAFPGVYSVGHPPRTPIEWASAAVLACGPTAALSHMSALALWGIVERWPRQPEVSVIRDRRPRGITVHHPRTLTRRDTTRHFGIRVTTPARTLYDCAPKLPDARLARVVNDALLSPHLHASHLEELLRRLPCPRLQPFVDTDDGPTRSGFEDDFKAFCARYGLPKPRVNVYVCGYLVDAYFPDERTIVELDGWNFHSSRTAFESDRLRDATILAAGIVTVRITKERLEQNPQPEADRLLRILRGRGRGARATRDARPAPRRPPGRPAR